ncbi:MAG TPA: outer membrane beta-barrel protein [Methylomirabilota bacterium]|nr:outer membrane beta-barrel protein [Methylomirabilota bacterium]
MQAHVRAWLSITVVMTLLIVPRAFAQEGSEIEMLKQELRRLQDRLQKLETAQRAPAPAPPGLAAPVSPAANAPAGAPANAPVGAMPVATQMQVPAQPGEREIQLEGRHPFELIGLPKPEVGNVRLGGFFVGSASYNSRLQMVPEFAGGAPALADPGHLNFRFDKFGLSASTVFAPWLSASAAVEVESHRDRHAHGFDPAFGCPGPGVCIERFGAEEAETEINLDKLAITAVAPVGNGLAVSFGRFDVPFGIERHDEPLLLTATPSELFQFGRPQRMTGFQASYQVAPWLDVTTWAVNRWESETTHDPFDDNNRDKSFGGRIGVTPLAAGDQLLNFGLGAFWGPEQDDDTRNKRWVVDVDATWTPFSRLLLAAEAVYGRESGVSFRRRGIPYPAPAVDEQDVSWWAFYVLAHYDIVNWLGVSARYGFFDDRDGARTGVEQILQSWTLTPVVHLSRLVPGLRPTGATYARTRHPIDWIDVKLEYRLNHSNKSVFSDARPGVDILDASHESHQVQLQFVVNF